MNLDCEPDSVLRRVAADRRIGPDVRAYANLTLRARSARLGGRIGHAIQLEAICDRIYESLAPADRW